MSDIQPPSRRLSYAIAAAVVVLVVAVVIVSVRSNSAGVADPSGVASLPAPTGPETVTVVAVGDIACDPASSGFNDGVGSTVSCGQLATSDLALALDPDAALLLGDIQYECGGYEAFLESFDPSWGRLKAITHPVPGNHEYVATGTTGTGTDCSSLPDAAGYYRYFGAAAGDPAQGWYSLDIGAWHVIALNSNCAKVGGCGKNSPQGKWLASDLAADESRCSLAFWHFPRFSSGHHGNTEALSAIWELLDDAGVDVVLAGHDHEYERFAPLDAAQQPRPDGITSFVVGTGGKSLRPFEVEEAGSEIRVADTFGVLSLALGEDSFGWQFLPASGETALDEGTGACQ